MGMIGAGDNALRHLLRIVMIGIVKQSIR